MKTNKLLFLLTGLLAFSLLNGCAKKTESAAQTVGSAAAPIEITVEVFDRGTDGGKTNPTNNEWAKWIQAKFLKDEHINVVFVPVNRGNEEQEIVTRMAAQDAPDICYTYSMDNVRNWGLQGGVYDLAPYVDTHLQDMKDMMGEDPSIPGQNLIWHSKDVDTGALYGISNKYMYTASHNTFIRKDWLDTLGLPEPTTTQEFFDCLLAFKNNAAKLGVERVVPFIMATDIRWQAYNIFLSFMPPDLSPRDKWVNTVAERQLLVPGVKDALRFLNKMYLEGLIDPDFPLYIDDSAPANVMKSGIVGAFQHNWDHPYRQNLQIQTDLEKNIPGAKYIPIDPFTNAAGLTPKRGSPAAGGLIFFIPKASKNPEAALRYANWLCCYENYHFLQFGAEGINHTTVNGVAIPLTAAGPWIQNSAANVDYTMSINGYVVPTEQFGQVLAAGYPGIPLDEVTAAYRIASLNAKVEPYISATILSLAPVRQVLVNKEKVLCVNLICAKPGEFDRVWDEGIQDWLSSGAQAVIDEQKTKYR
ncbi:MAG: extracellular solute-binding protein [Treponema sp.]|jgi:putative aldouronate transport system substrate-binding protein|nr:extracellular solute-binding protein [Treponema sp.]